MIVDLNSGELQLPLTVDVCIVGGGPASISFALRLAKKKPNSEIAILESGGLQYENESQQLYRGVSAGHPYFPLESTRLRMLGGSTGHWTGWCTPFQAHDFNEKPWISHSGWPFDAREMRSYYETANEFFKLSSRGYLAADWLDTFDSLQTLNLTSLSPAVWQHSSPPVNVGLTYQAKLEKADNITVVLHANATALKLDASGQTLSAVEISNLEKSQLGSVSASNYVLACGGIETPRLMLDSDDIATNGIGNDFDNVGRYFMDHLQTENGIVYDIKLKTMRAFRKSLSPQGQKVSLGFVPKDTLQEQKKIAGGIAYVTRFDRAREDHQLDGLKHLKRQVESNRWDPDFLGHALKTLRELDSLIALLTFKARETIGSEKSSTGSNIVLGTFCEQVPNRNSRIKLSQELDSLGNRLPSLHWQLLGQDFSTIRETNLAAGIELARLGLGRLQLEEWLTSGDTAWPNYIIAAHHPMGTTRMSTTPSDGVVDLHCKVHGIDNLYIAGSSVFPTGSYANPTLTIVALSHRLADHLSMKLANHNL